MEQSKTRKNPKFIRGTVVGDKMEKTRVVEVRLSHTHHLYKKRTVRRKRFFVHDEKNESKTGDLVLAYSTKPISKNKCFRLSKVLEKNTVENVSIETNP